MTELKEPIQQEPDDKPREDLSQGRKWSDELDEREGGWGDLEMPEDPKD